MGNSDLITLEEGDYLEHSYKDTIRIYLSNYELLWRIYIGHDGNGKMPELKALVYTEATKRQQVGERLYTCLESLICIHEISEGNLSVDLKDKGSYIKMLNLFIAFQAHCGRIRDNFSYLGELLCNDGKTLTAGLENIYQQRNTVLHGKKVPMRIEDSLTILPSIGGSEPTNSDWLGKLSWDDESFDVNFLQDYLLETKKQLLNECNSIIGRLLIPVKEIVRKNSIVIPKPTFNGTYRSPSGEVYEPIISGSTVTYNHKVKLGL